MAEKLVGKTYKFTDVVNFKFGKGVHEKHIAEGTIVQMHLAVAEANQALKKGVIVK